MFATTKWKPKLLAAHAGMALYFDSTEISESNKCAQVLWSREDTFLFIEKRRVLSSDISDISIIFAIHLCRCMIDGLHGLRQLQCSCRLSCSYYMINCYMQCMPAFRV